MSHRTTFTDAAAVDAWDGWFRWRQGNRLHDLTIDATWERVVDAASLVEGEHAEQWSQRWLQRLSRWQWLPDETFLRDAGTGAPPRSRGPVAAVLNMHAFVRPRPFESARAQLDTRAIADTAAEALRFLDDALLALPSIEEPGLRLGLLGLAHAFDAMGIGYDSPAALRVAHVAGAAFASGALRGAIELARERGGSKPALDRLTFLRDHGLPKSLVDDALRWGVRHEPRTAISLTPRLALLANNVSDALDPHPSGRTGDVVDDGSPAPPSLPSPAAQLRVRSAMQPWIDESIDYPFKVAAGRNEEGTAEGQRVVAVLHSETVTPGGRNGRR